MDMLSIGRSGARPLPPGFPVDEFTQTVGDSIAEVTVHVFRTPVRPDGTHLFLYERVRCRREDVFATGGSVIVRQDGVERVFRLAADLGPCQIDISGDTPYSDRADLLDFVSGILDDLRTDTARKRLPKLSLRVDLAPEVLVDPRSLSVHGDGLFRIGHGWLMRWEDVADAIAPQNPHAAADLRLYAVDGRCVVVRIDLI